MDDPSSACRETGHEKLSRLRRLVELAPSDPELRYALAGELIERSQFDEAVDLLQTVIAMSPNHLAARKLLDRMIRSRSSVHKT